MAKMTPRRLLVTLCLILALTSISLPASAQIGLVGDTVSPQIAWSETVPEDIDSLYIDGYPPEKGNPKLDSTLNRLVNNSNSPLPASIDAGLSSSGNSLVRVVVETQSGFEQEVIGASSKIGEIEVEYNGLLQINLAASGLEELAGLRGVRFIRLPYQPLPAVISEGVNLINAATWQTAGFHGSGVKIGIIDSGFSGYQSLQSQGELPSSVTTHWSASLGGPGSGIHGSACAEVVYDIAPGATYYYANFSNEVEFGAAVDWMITQQVNVITCSVGWPGVGPGNGTGPIDQIVDRAYNAGILWSQSAGNQAQRHWSGSFVSTDGDDLLDFTAGDEGNTISVVAGQPIIAILSWNDSWGASANDYDLALFDNTATPVASSVNVQNGNDDPYEGLSFTATYTGNYSLAIARSPGAAIRTLHLYTYYEDMQYQVPGGSIAVPADSIHVTTVGAVPWNNPTSIEPFSSQGPNTSGVIKPDIVAPDRVSNVTYPSGFAGTSAAAPCVAGAAALVKEANPSFTHTQLKSYLESNAVDLGASGKDNTFGSGRLTLGAPPGQLRYLTQAQSITAGTASGAITVQTQDAAGNPLNVGANTTVNMTSSSSAGKFDISSDGLFNGTVTGVTIPVGSNSASIFYKDTAAGSPILTASNAGFYSNTQQETIVADLPATIRVETAGDGSGTLLGAQSLVAGNGLALFGIARDQYNNFVANPDNTTWTLINKTGGVADTDLSATVGASVTLTAHLTGSTNIHAVNGTLSSIDSGTITIAKGVLDHLQVLIQPASTLSVDPAFSTQPQVLALDAGGNPLSGVSIVADRDPATGTGILRGTLSLTTNASGLAAFTNLAYNKTDAFKVRFSAGARSVISDQLGPLPAGAVTSISIAASPVSGVSVDIPLSPSPAILVRDQFGNPVGGDNVTVAVSTGTPSALRGTTTITSAADTGLAVFTDLGYNESGQTFTLRFTCSTLSLNGGSLGPLVVGEPTQIKVETTADGSGTLVGVQSLLSGNSLTVFGITRDQYNNFVANPDNTTWSLVNKTGGIADTDLSSTSGANVILSGHLTGSAAIQAANGTLTSIGSGTIFVNPLPPSTIAISTPPVAGSTVDDLLATQPVILVTDQDNNTMGGVWVTASVGTGSGTLRGTLSAVSDIEGLAVFSDLGYSAAGESFILHFASMSGQLTTDSAPLGQLAPGASVSIRAEYKADGSDRSTGRSAVIGQKITLYSIIRDQFANFVAHSQGTWSLVNKTGGVQDTDLAVAPDGLSAVFTGTKKGSASIRVSSGNLASGDYSVVVIAGDKGGGGPGGGGSSSTVVALQGLISTRPVEVNRQGVIQSLTQLKTADGKVVIDISTGTKLLTSTNNVISSLKAGILASPPLPPDGSTIVSAYSFTPDGAKFDPALTLIISYDPARLPERVAEKDLYIAYYDGAQWQKLESTIDTRSQTVSAKITHFSSYALMGKVTPAPTPSPSPSQPPSPIPVPTSIPSPVTRTPSPAAMTAPEPTATIPAPKVTPSMTIPVTPPGQPAKPMPPWLIILIVVPVLAVILMAVIYVSRSRKAKGK